MFGVASAVIFGSLLGIVTLSVSGQPQTVDFKADLSGYQEIPAVSTAGSGSFKARLVPDKSAIEFELSYSNLEGTVERVRLHFGQRGVDGGIIANLCGTFGKPACPSNGKLTGSITASNIFGPARQGIGDGEFEEVVRAIREGATYVNVYTTAQTAGEIRGQING